MDFLVPPFLDFLPSKDLGVSPPPTFELLQLMLILILLLMKTLVWRFMLMSMLILMVLIVKIQCFFTHHYSGELHLCSSPMMPSQMHLKKSISCHHIFIGKIYFVSLQVHLQKYISCHHLHLCIVKEDRRRQGWTDDKNKRLASHEYSL